MPDINNNVLPKSFYTTENGQQQLTVDKKLADAVRAGIRERLDQLPDSERSAFLAMTANLAPGDVGTPAQLDGVLDAFAGAARQLATAGSPAAVYIGDIADFVARTLIKSANGRRENALQNRMAAHEQAKADLDSQAAHSKAAADKQQSAAISGLVGSTVGGGVGLLSTGASIGGNVYQVGKMAKVAGPMGEQTTKLKEMTGQVNQLKSALPNVQANAQAGVASHIADLEHEIDATKLLGRQNFDIAQSNSQIFSAVGQAGSSAGEINRGGGSAGQGQLEADSKRADAEGSKDAAAAQMQDQVAERNKALLDATDDFVQQIIRFVKELQDSHAQAMQSIKI